MYFEAGLCKAIPILKLYYDLDFSILEIFWSAPDYSIICYGMFLIYNACQVLTTVTERILIVEVVSKHQQLEAYLHFLVSKC